MAFGQAELQLQPSDEVRHVRSLCAVVGMELVEDEILQQGVFVALVVVPQGLIARAHQSVVEHLEVGEQDVRRVVENPLRVFYDMCLIHLCRERRGLLSTAYEQSHGYLAVETGILVYGLCQTAGLVGCQGIHRIEDNRLDATEQSVAPAIVKYRELEAFGLTGACTRSQQCVLRLMPVFCRQTIKGFQLMLVGRKVWLDVKRNRRVFLRTDERRLQ